MKTIRGLKLTRKGHNMTCGDGEKNDKGGMRGSYKIMRAKEKEASPPFTTKRGHSVNLNQGFKTGKESTFFHQHTITPCHFLQDALATVSSLNAFQGAMGQVQRLALSLATSPDLEAACL